MPTKTKSSRPTKPAKKSIKRLYRSETDRVIGGVSAGLAEYFQLDPALVRLVFLLLFVFGGSGLLLYLALWIVVPTESNIKSSDYVRQNTEEIRSQAENFANSLRGPKSADSQNPSIGLIFIILGGVFLLFNFGLLSWIDLGKFWPVFLIILGFILLARNK